MGKLSISAASHTGCVRSNNEDMILVNDRTIRGGFYETELSTEGTDRFLFAVADGMGGHNAGEVASEMTLTNLRYFISDLPRGLSVVEFKEAVDKWLGSINALVEGKGLSEPEKKGMGTTLVALIYYCGHVMAMSCGDSRLYRFRDGKLAQLTEDHTLVKSNGPDQHSSAITNCIGAGCRTSFVDFYDYTNDVHSGDIYLMCTDGLHDMLWHPEIEALVKKGATAEAFCEAAVEAGGFDNVSTLLIEVIK